MSRLDVTCRACSDMADKEVTVITCTSLVFCALGVHARNTKKAKHAAWVQDYLAQTTAFAHFDTLDVSRPV